MASTLPSPIKVYLMQILSNFFCITTSSIKNLNRKYIESYQFVQKKKFIDAKISICFEEVDQREKKKKSRVLIVILFGDFQLSDKQKEKKIKKKKE